MGAPASLAPRMTIADRFRLEHVLGKGAMGSVWVAHHLGLGVDVAVKFIDPALLEVSDIKSRFSREAKAAARIKSPHVVQILDSGADETGRPYIAMELLRGEDLAARITREGQLALADVVRVVTQACKGLSKAHAAGVVHRDLKPENLFLCEDEDEPFVLKILDFGVAKADHGDSAARTVAGTLLGTPMYMSPEQAMGKVVDHRTDLYSLGAVAYHAITGRTPFTAENIGELIVAITRGELGDVSLHRRGVPPAVQAWLRRAMHKEATARFQSAREMADALVRAVDGGAALPDWSTAFDPRSIAKRDVPEEIEPISIEPETPHPTSSMPPSGIPTKFYENLTEQLRGRLSNPDEALGPPVTTSETRVVAKPPREKKPVTSRAVPPSTTGEPPITDSQHALRAAATVVAPPASPADGGPDAQRVPAVPGSARKPLVYAGLAAIAVVIGVIAAVVLRGL